MSGTNEQAVSVGRRIRKLRQGRALTQSELASRLGIQQSDLSRMERGKYRVSLDTLFKVLCEFELSISDFFGVSANPEQRGLAPMERQVLETFSALDSTSQEEVRAFIEFKLSQKTRGGDEGTP